MQAVEWAKEILYGSDLNQKLIPLQIIDEKLDFSPMVANVPASPGRSQRIQFSEKRIKFPKRAHLIKAESRAEALHFFANHELLAIEMMAAAFLYLSGPKEDLSRVRYSLIRTITDEQRHLGLYISRMNRLGIDFGDLPLNNFFWRIMRRTKDFPSYFSLMSLTFETANLDFSLYYRDIFEQVGDSKTALILNEVYEDEITHVAIGQKWSRKWCKTQDLWKHYLESLPEGISPARAKGIGLDIKGRKRAGLNETFIKNIANWKEGNPILDRGLSL